MRIRKLIISMLIISMAGIFGFMPPVDSYAETTEENVKENNKTYYSDAYRAGHDDDFSKEEAMDSDDYNYGWELGKFCVSGYSARLEDSSGNYVFLKNVDDKMKLTFVLEQEDIHCLNGNSKLYIRELDSRDEYFQTQNIDFGHGTLILRHTDYEGTKHEPIIYTNFLEALEVGVENEISIDGPDTKVYLLEEGDYEVALDYRVGKEKDGPLFVDPKDPYQDYKIFFRFSVRNGNCMTFIKDAVTGNELTNESVTQNGFVVDMANSKYLQVNIKKEVMSDGRDGLVEDTRFNRPVSDGEKFTDEGMYTLTTKNMYTNEQTIKKIYVGSDEVMIAFINSKYTIKKINDMLAQGCTIDENGNIIWPEIDTTTEIDNNPVVSTNSDADSANDADIDSANDSENKNLFERVKEKFGANPYMWIGIASVVGLLILVIIIGSIRKKIKKKKSQKDFSKFINDEEE